MPHIERITEAAKRFWSGIALGPKFAALHANTATALPPPDEPAGVIASNEAALRHGSLSTHQLERLALAYAADWRLGDRTHIHSDVLVASMGLPAPHSPKAWATIAVMLHERAEHDAAVSLCWSALRYAPDDAGIRAVLAGILVDVGTRQAAAAICRELVATTPDDRAYYILGRALTDTGDDIAAVEAFRHCLELNGCHVAALSYLAAALVRLGLHHLAIPLLEMVVEARPEDAEAHSALGNALQLHGETAAARVHFLRSSALQPLVTWQAAGKPEFAALLVHAPGAANTPFEFLFGDSSYDRHFVAVLPETVPDIALLDEHGDVVVNLISDVDKGADVLAAAARAIDSLGKPTINHPRKIMATARDTVAQRLAGISACRVPATRRLTRVALAALDHSQLVFPLLLRVAGTHGGDAFEKMETGEDIANFLATHQADEFYISEYVDYRSEDGFFRKYRFVFTDAEILPYHLAIGKHWKIHHCTTDMVHHPWMQEEEKGFLRNPHSVFLPAHYDALAAIRAAVSLDFFGIDCALDRDRNIVVFEVNASMLIHDHNADFPYKTPSCVAIKAALDAMLQRAAEAAALN